MPNYGKDGPYVLPPSSPLLFLDHALFINALQPRLRGLVASIREGVGRPRPRPVGFGVAMDPGEKERQEQEENKEPYGREEE